VRKRGAQISAKSVKGENTRKAFLVGRHEGHFGGGTINAKGGKLFVDERRRKVVCDSQRAISLEAPRKKRFGKKINYNKEGPAREAGRWMGGKPPETGYAASDVAKPIGMV